MECIVLDETRIDTYLCYYPETGEVTIEEDGEIVERFSPEAAKQVLDSYVKYCGPEILLPRKK